MRQSYRKSGLDRVGYRDPAYRVERPEKSHRSVEPKRPSSRAFLLRGDGDSYGSESDYRKD